MKEKFSSNSEDDTFRFASELAGELKPGSVIALHGDLGAGKTIFAKGVAAGLGVKEEITSPTFSIMEVYEGKTPFYHFDLYRIENIHEFSNLRFDEYWDGDGVSVIEWPEKAEGLLPAERIDVHIHYIDENRREIAVEHTDH